MTDSQRAKTIKTVAMVGPTDEFAMDAKENLYLTPVEKNNITVMDKNGAMSILVASKDVAWPDSLWIKRDSILYFTISRWHENNAPTDAYKIFRVKLR